MQSDIPRTQTLAWAAGTAACTVSGGYIPAQQVPVWVPEPAEDTHTQPIQAWVPDHSDSLAGRPWKPGIFGAGALTRAQQTDAVVCEPVSYDMPQIYAQKSVALETPTFQGGIMTGLITTHIFLHHWLTPSSVVRRDGVGRG